MRLFLPSLLAASAAILPVQVLATASPLAQSVPAGEVRELEPVPLRMPVKALPEQWEDRPVEGKGVRNVVNPTLTPVLPQADASNGLAVIVAPGGGFLNLAFDNEGMRVARELAQRGIAAFVLKYRVNPTPRDEADYRAYMASFMARLSKPANGDPVSTPREAIEDAIAAVRTVRNNAGKWGVDPAKVGMIGFSAGAMTTLGAAIEPDAAARPDFIAPVYGPRIPGPIPADAPPMFLAIALDDPLFRFENTTALIEAWHETGRPMEVHLYGKGGHGFGMTPRSDATGLWMQEFVAWMKDRGLMLDAKSRIAHEIGMTRIGALVADPATRAVLVRHVPGLVEGPGAAMAGGLSMNDLRAFAPQMLPQDIFDAIMAEISALRVR